MKRNINIFLPHSNEFFVHGQAVNKDVSSASRRTILFVCEHGAGRSAIAAAFFNRMAKEQSLSYHVSSEEYIRIRQSVQLCEMGL